MIHFFYADPHFGHRNIIEFCDRPFESMGEMNDRLIERYNEDVLPSQTVCWVGDCVFGSAEYAKRILGRMNGRKMLVRGNHDGSVNRCLSMGFDVVVDQLFLTIEGRQTVVNHFPYGPTGFVVDRYKDRRPTRVDRRVLIHGHTHSTEKFDGPTIHVGVDAWDYRPAPFDAVADYVRSLP